MSSESSESTSSNHDTNKIFYNYWIIGASTFFLLGSLLLYFYPFFLDKSIWAHDVGYDKIYYKNFINLIKGSLNLYIINLTFFIQATAKVVFYCVIFSLMFISGWVFLRTLRIPPLPAIIAAYLYAFNPNVFTFIRHGHIGKITLMSLIPFAFAGITYYMKSPSPFKHKLIFNTLLLSSIGVIFGLTNGAAQTQGYIILLFIAYLITLIITNINSNISNQAHTTDNQLNNSSKLNLFKKLCFNRLIYLIIIPIIFLITSPQRNINSFSRLMGSYVFISSEKIKEEKDLATIIAQGNTTGLHEGQPIRNQRSDDNWAFATGYSIKKLETLSFIFPELFGYYSADSAFPYWGAKGNHTIDLDKYLAGRGEHFSNIYLGLFYIMFLLLGIIYGPKKKYFWGIILIITLFLAWGKFFFVYKLFYSLPYMNKIRNPIKFLHVFVLAGLPLVGYGAAYFINSLKSQATINPLTKKPYHKPYRFFYWGIIVVNLTGLIAFFSVLLFKNSIISHFNHLSPRLIALIYQNIFIAILKGVLIINLILGLGYFLLKINNQPNPSKKIKLALTLLLCCIAVADLFWVNHRFMVWHKDNTFTQDATYETLKQLNPKKNGLLLYTKTNNNYTTFFKNRLEPFFDSPKINYATIYEPYDPSIRYFSSTRQREYFQKIKQSTFNEITNHQTRYQLFGIGYIISGIKLNELEGNQTLSLIRKDTYNVVKTQILPESESHTVLEVSPPESNTNNLENVFLYKVNQPRAIFHTIENLFLVDKPRNTTSIITQTTFDPRKTGIIQNEFYQRHSDKLAPFLISSTHSSTTTDNNQSTLATPPPTKINNIQQISTSHYRIKITPQSKPSILNFSLPYYGGWHAYQDGKPLTHFPINRIQNGYIINPSNNSNSASIIDIKIELDTSEKVMFGLELSKFIILLLFAVAYFREYRKKSS